MTGDVGSFYDRSEIGVAISVVAEYFFRRKNFLCGLEGG